MLTVVIESQLCVKIICAPKREYPRVIILINLDDTSTAINVCNFTASKTA